LIRAVSELTEPLQATEDTEALASALRRFIGDSGLLFERRLGQSAATTSDLDPEWLVAGRAPSGELEAVPRDARVLLAMIRRLAAARDAPVSAGSPFSREASRAALDDLKALAERSLSRQLDLAYQWLRTGQLELQLPLLLGDDLALACLRVGADDEARAKPGAGRHPFTLDVHVELRGVGRLEAWVQWAGSAVTVRLFVDGEHAQALARTELVPLVEGLHRAGFARVDTDVVVDPIRLTRSQRRPETPIPPEGSIFTARA
jgi:hypothetical protein